MNRKFIGGILLVAGAITLAVSTILLKIIPELTPLEPQHVSMWRFLIAAPVLWLVSIFLKPSPKSSTKFPLNFLLMGAVFATSSYCAVFALERLPSSLYVIIVYIYPSLVVLFSLITKKAVPKLIWLGLPMTLLGLVLTVYQFGSKLSVDLTGLIITLINAMALGGYLILSELFFKNEPSKFRGTKWMLTSAMSIGLILIPFLGLPFPDTVWGWILTLTLGILGTIVPILSINIGLQFIGAARGAVIVTLQPVAAVLFSTLFLGETLSIQQWIGGVLVIIAIVILQLSDDREHNKRVKGAG